MASSTSLLFSVSTIQSAYVVKRKTLIKNPMLYVEGDKQESDSDKLLSPRFFV
jgi:hypothetical protein